MELSPLERELMDLLLDGDDPRLATLRDQLSMAGVSSREFTGSGFFTYFAVADGVARVRPDAMHIGDVWFGLHGRLEGGEALLWVANGVLHSLEAFSRDGEWPEDAVLDGVHYFGESRDPEALFGSWGG